jgi:dTDP-4-dehydrorhamnose 3,5-epimerase
MHFEPTPLAGAFLIEPTLLEDARGFFARTFCEREFGERGLVTSFVQCSISFTARRGTVRGMHYQLPPAREVKLVRCTAGALYDVIVDLRPASSTYLQHYGTELTAENRRALYVPEGFAHGMQTLADSTEVFYQISAFHAPDRATGIRYDDPRLGIRWPLPVSVVAEKDTRWPLLAAPAPHD